MTDNTTEYYNKNSLEFIEGTINVDTGILRDRFLKYIQKSTDKIIKYSILFSKCLKQSSVMQERRLFV